jgi:hypothetical protein
LGALQAARTTGRLIDEDATLDACLHDRSLDPQLESRRAPWLIEIVSAAEAVDGFRGPIRIDRCLSLTDERG